MKSSAEQPIIISSDSEGEREFQPRKRATPNVRAVSGASGNRIKEKEKKEEKEEEAEKRQPEEGKKREGTEEIEGPKGEEESPERGCWRMAQLPDWMGGLNPVLMVGANPSRPAYEPAPRFPLTPSNRLMLTLQHNRFVRNRER